jgi:hypothetical protein
MFRSPLIKVSALIGAIILSILNSPAESFRLEGEFFQPPTNFPIVWKATNAMPSGLWIYKVMPEAFSAAVVSNAMRIGHFEMKDVSKTSEAQSPLKDKHLIYCYNRNEFGKPRFLYIAPTVGAMEYGSQRDYKATVESVPTSEETERLARDVLFQLGIDRSLLAEKVRNGYDEISTKIDPKTHQLSGTPQVVMRGISFERRIDGVPLSSSWCFLIHFRSHGTIEDFTLHWRNFLPSESHRTLTPAEIIEMIKSGQSVFPSQAGASKQEVSEAKMLTVVKVTPRYFNGSGKEWIDFLYPYADLEIAANVDADTVTFHLNCPILFYESRKVSR